MAKIEVEQRIRAPKPKVFEVFSDFEHVSERIEGIQSLELLTPLPVGVGTKFRETRMMFKKEAVEEMEITQFTPHDSYTVEAHSHGCHYVTTYDFTEEGEETLVKMIFETRPISFFAKIFSPLSALMMGTVKKCLMADMTDLKTHLEQAST